MVHVSRNQKQMKFAASNLLVHIYPLGNYICNKMVKYQYIYFMCLLELEGVGSPAVGFLPPRSPAPATLIVASVLGCSTTARGHSEAASRGSRGSPLS